MSFVLFDTETNGLEPPRRLVSIAWIQFRRGPDGQAVIEEQVHKIVRPVGFEICNSEIHGITHSQACDEGEELDAVLALFRSTVNKCQCVFAYNMPFDKSVIEGEAKDPAFFAATKTRCALQMARVTLRRRQPAMENFKLGQVYRTLIDAKGFHEHNALSDSQATLAVLDKLEQMPEQFFPVYTLGSAFRKLIENDFFCNKTTKQRREFLEKHVELFGSK